MNALFYQDFLNREFERRKTRNPRFSLRAFARNLELAPATLSQVLSGKRLPTRLMCERILAKLSPADQDRKRFTDSVASARHLRDFGQTSPALERIRELTTPTHWLSDEKYLVISDWYHYAILEAVHLDEFQPEPSWIARKFGISMKEARAAIARLFALGLLEIQGDRWVKTHARLSFSKEHSKVKAARARHKQIYAKAIEAMEKHSPEARSHLTFTLAIDSKKVPEARKMTQTFLEDLAGFLESGKRDEVYEICLAIFPLQEPSSPR